MNRAIKFLLGLPTADMARADSWRIGFTAEYGNYVKLALILAFIALVYLTIRSYRREGDAPTGAKVTLMSMRIAALALVFAIIFNPAIVLRFLKTLRSTVVVLIDDSRSMSFTDRYGQAPGGSDLAAFLGIERDSLGKLSRMEIVRRCLLRPGGGIEKLTRDHPLLLMRFSTASPGKEAYTRKLDEIPFQAAKERNPASLPAGLIKALDQLACEGYETNIPAALRDALERTEGRRVAAILLISDGQITARGASGRLAAATEYAAQRVGGGVPLYAVAIGDPTPPKNVAVTGLQAPREVKRLAQVEVSVVLSHRHMGGQSVNVRLLRRPADKTNWVDTGQGHSVKLDEGQAQPGGKESRSRGLKVATLKIEPKEVGRFVYKAVVDPVPGESITDDNSAETTIEVSDEKSRILLISGDGGWEFQYLKNFLLRSSDTYRLSVWQQNADKDINQAASTGMKLSRLPRNLEELIGSPSGDHHPGYDVVVLFDPQPTQNGFDQQFVAMLKTFVSKHGGGLCFVAGNKYAESVLLGGGLYRPLEDLLPVLLGPNTIDLAVRIGTQRAEPGQFVLTSYGIDHPVMRLGTSAGETKTIWGMESATGILPGIYWSHPVSKVKPAAKVLAHHSNPLRRTAKNDAEPLVAVQPVGAGRVVYVGSDETWRWRFVRDGYYHRRFWANTVRYLATVKARQVVITTGGDRFLAGEKITVEAEAYDEKFEPIREPTFKIIMQKVGDEGDSQTITLKAVDVDKKPGRYKGAIVAKHTGTYKLTALAGDPLAAEKVASKRIVIELPQAESRRTEADLATMKNVASRNQNFMLIHEINRLDQLIPPGLLRTVHEQPHYLWDTPTMLIGIVLLLTAEWILRKKYNMA
ncbi:MAG: hypothetical protein ISS78_08995 [Phycisphaerae bacterium]|nr:hypothetical protein [Phycisphaerae bacterium]